MKMQCRGNTRTGWADHWTNGGTGITKFKPELLDKYKRAVEQFGDSQIWLRGCELHSSLNDLSKFWRLFESL